MTTASTTGRALGVRLAALSVGQVVSWGILYYALIVAAPAIADELHLAVLGTVLRLRPSPIALTDGADHVEID